MFSNKRQGISLLKYYRLLILGAGTTYLIWWVLVEALLPGSFNPLLSRLLVVSFCLLVFLASYWSQSVRRSIQSLFLACLWLITSHYFYLFYGNPSDINWVVGTYVTVIAVSACIGSNAALMSYSIFVLILSIFLVCNDPVLLYSIFLPGLLTVMLFNNMGLRERLKWIAQSRENSQWFQSLFDAVFEGIVVHEKGRILHVNESFSRIFGYSRDELLTMHVLDLVVPESRHFILEKIETLFDGPYECTGLKKNGDTIIIEIRGKRHLLENKVLRLAAVSDITARKKGEQARVLYEASQESIRIRDDFLSIASHELKTPLTCIQLQTQMILRKMDQKDVFVDNYEKVQKMIELTERQTKRLTRLVEEMLDVSRISSGKIEIHCETFDLVELVKDTILAFGFSLDINQSSNKEGHLLPQIKFHSPSQVFISADRFRIEQVITNLLSNAIKYGQGTPIEVEIRSSGNQTEIRVADRGIGISLKDQDRIFNRFERAIPYRNISGLGLGLYICKHIIESHHGRIGLRSQLGDGTEFTVLLPVQDINSSFVSKVEKV